ncbi:hypothetical protein RJT34_24667 [Clitoria ternatea]|uniref:Uncharacterized protein n=1 Tax=Clitoria ternatea TaxID=43366 RepID=A0AAN9FNB1_CLITE
MEPPQTRNSSLVQFEKNISPHPFLIFSSLPTPTFFHSVSASASHRRAARSPSNITPSPSSTAPDRRAVEHRAVTVKPLTVNPSLPSTLSPSR